MTESNPFRKFKISGELYGTPYYITKAELKQLEEADLSARPDIAVQRDIFVFQCCIGCRVGDLFAMTRDNVTGGFIEYIARKTKDDHPVTVRVPLNATAKKILNRYADDSRNALLPFVYIQKYNDSIKDAFMLAGLDRSVTILNPTTGEEEKRPLYAVASSHLARRTFVGNLYKQVKDPNLVGKLSGHKEGSRAFARYRDIDDDMTRELVALLD